MDLPAAIIVAAAALDGFTALLFAVGYLQRRADAEEGVAALLCVAAGAHAVGSLVLAHTSDDAVALIADRLARLGLIAALPMAVHFAIAYGKTPPQRKTLAALYGGAVGIALLDAYDVPRFAGIGGSLEGVYHDAHLGAAGIAASSAAVVASIGIVVIVARAYLAGRREALAVVVGATILLGAAVNDLGVVSGALTTGLLIDAGLAAFVASVMTTRSARLVVVTQELERRTKELRTRTSELRLSYEDLRAAQEELLKKEQLAVVGELAAVIAHEVRNPLAIISNAVSGLRKQAISRQDHETLLEILDEETSRLNRLVTDLLRYSRPVNLQRSDLSLADVLDRALSLAGKDHKGIRTELKVEGHDGRISGDANLLRQVFDNLVVNAVQAMGVGGLVTVRVRAATEEGVEGVAVDIIDTGEGMDTQVRSRARDPFFTTRPSGTGLGLAIVDRIVEAHGGRLAIDSRSGEGTTVTVFLPTGSPNEAAVPRSRAAKAPSQASGPARAAR